MQTSFPGKDAFHRVPDFPQKRFAICHLPSAISGSACLRPLQCKRSESRISSKSFSPAVFSAFIASLRFKGRSHFGCGSAASSLCGPCVRVPTWQTSLQNSGLTGTLALPGNHFWRAQPGWRCRPRAPFHNNNNNNRK
jgi:hypothetical protein